MEIKKIDDFLESYNPNVQEDPKLDKEKFIDDFIVTYTYIEPNRDVIGQLYNEFYERYYDKNYTNDMIMDLVRDMVVSRNLLEVQK